MESKRRKPTVPVKSVPVVLPQKILPHNFVSHRFCPNDPNSNPRPNPYPNPYPKLSVVEQDVTGAKSLGFSALGHDVLGQYVGLSHGIRIFRCEVSDLAAGSSLRAAKLVNTN